jgi:hypothetical protein
MNIIVYIPNVILFLSIRFQCSRHPMILASGYDEYAGAYACEAASERRG